MRRSAGVHWSTVEHVTAVLAAFVFTPGVLYAWLRDPATGAGTVTEKPAPTLAFFFLLFFFLRVADVGINLWLVTQND